MKRSILGIGMVLFLASLATAQADLQPAAIVKLVKTEQISVKQLKTQVEDAEKAEGRTLTPAERRMVLDVMINERLVLQAAERDKLIISEAEVNQQIQQMRAQLSQNLSRPITDAEFAQAVKNDSGLEFPAFREQVRRRYTLQKYLQEKKKAVFQSFQAPAEADIQNFYNVNKAQFVRPETVRISMIQIPLGKTAAEKAKAKTLAEQLVREIGSNPAKFDEAVIRSKTASPGYQGGDAGYLPRNPQALQLVGQELLDTAFRLKQGEVSRLIENSQGYHILKITETYEMKNLTLNDIIQPGNLKTVREYITEGMTQDRQQSIIAKATQELVAELRQGTPFQIFENNLNW